jgi:hypothetical protein
VVEWREIESYGVFVRQGVTRGGQGVWGNPEACFIEERNALERKRQLEAAGYTVLVQPFRIYYRGEQEKRRWLADYCG